jgi:stalled ribosome rescue protein Dom34
MLSMNTNIGLWISHQKAEIIVAARHQERVSVVWNQAGSGLQTKCDRKVAQFYNQIIAQIQDASSLLIFGPDDAKSELQQRLALLRPKVRTVNVEDMTSMTAREIMLKVRGHFRPEYQSVNYVGVNTP